MSYLEPIALPKKLYDKAKELGVISITLEFSGGHDEGFLYVGLVEEKTDNLVKIVKRKQQINQLQIDIETWADDAYNYSGAGDGNDYGDNVTYDLKTMKASVSSWHMERRVDSEPETIDFSINENKEDEDNE